MITEAEFMAQVIELARVLGWHWAHFRPAQTRHGWRTPVQGPLGAGFPDLVLVHPRKQRVVYLELKSEKGKLSAAQGIVHGILLAAGCEVYVWRPNDWDEVVAVLRDRPEKEGSHGA